MFKYRIIAIAQLYFLHFLQEREFIGKLQFSHKSGKGHLDVIVGSDRNSQSTTKDLKCLSGGERSFATVCFIMSLWDAIEAPFRCLDEFDVYMVCLCVVCAVPQTSYDCVHVCVYMYMCVDNVNPASTLTIL